jgi:hypothetical protein
MCRCAGPFVTVRVNSERIFKRRFLDGFKIIDLALSHGDAQPKPSRRR